MLLWGYRYYGDLITAFFFREQGNCYLHNDREHYKINYNILTVPYIEIILHLMQIKKER